MQTSTQSTVDPMQPLLRMINGAWVTQAIFVAAKLGIADLLRDGPKTSAALAAATSANEDALYRLLRALSSLGIFHEETDGRFSLTPMADCLRSDFPSSVRPYAIMMGEQWVWRSWGEALHSVRTGECAFEHVFGTTPFRYYVDHPEAGRISAEGLSSRSTSENAAIVAACDFANAETIVDVGGGRGSLIAAVLAAQPALRGVLFDLSHMIEMAEPLISLAGIASRCKLVAGDFFKAIPKGGDIYILKKVIHDWGDDASISILKNCRAAISEHGRLLMIEWVVPSGNEASYAKLIDLLMLVYAGGRERTETEHRDLLVASGFRLNRVIPTLSGVSIVEALPH